MMRRILALVACAAALISPAFAAPVMTAGGGIAQSVVAPTWNINQDGTAHIANFDPSTMINGVRADHLVGLDANSAMPFPLSSRGASRLLATDGTPVMSVNPAQGDATLPGQDTWAQGPLYKPHALEIGNPRVGASGSAQDYNSNSQLIIAGNTDGPDTLGCLICVFNGDTAMNLAGISGGGSSNWANGASGIAQYGSADSPIEYLVADNAHAQVMNLTVASYTATEIVLKTALTPAQMARIHHGMYVITNSIDTTLTAPVFSASNSLPSPNYYASVVDSVIDSTHIAVSGWAVPGAGNGASGQVPSVSNLDTLWTNFGVPTVGIGAATNTSAINWVMNYTTTNSWLNNYENEIDILGNPGFAAGRMRIHGLTMTYQGPTPSADSWGLNLNTVALPVQLHMEVNPTGYGIQSNSFITKGNSGVNKLGDTWEMQESAAFADAAQNMRLTTWLAQDCATAGYGCVSVHQGLMVNGDQGTVTGQTPQAQIIYDPLLPGHTTNSTGTLALASFGGVDFSLDGGHPTVPQGNYLQFQPSTWTASNPTAPILQAASPSQLNVRDNGGNGITLDTFGLNVGSEADVGSLKSTGNITTGNELILTPATQTGTISPFLYARSSTEVDVLNSAGDHVQLDANSINTTGVASFGSNTIVRNGSLLELQYNGWTTGAVPQLQATAANVLAVRDTSGNGITLDSYSVKVSGLSGSGNAYACLDSAGNLYRSATACN